MCFPHQRRNIVNTWKVKCEPKRKSPVYNTTYSAHTCVGQRANCSSFSVYLHYYLLTVRVDIAIKIKSTCVIGLKVFNFNGLNSMGWLRWRSYNTLQDNFDFIPNLVCEIGNTPSIAKQIGETSCWKMNILFLTFLVSNRLIIIVMVVLKLPFWRILYYWGSIIGAPLSIHLSATKFYLVNRDS